MSRARVLSRLLSQGLRAAAASTHHEPVYHQAMVATRQGITSAASSAGLKWGVGLGFAALAGITTATATSAATQQAETVTVDGVKVTATGGAKIKHKVVFVLGGPGSGKGTQCAKLIEEFPDLVHMSAGDLLRAHVNSGTPDGNLVADMIRNGQIVPAEITIGLLQKAMAESGKQCVLIDGFPRNADNRDTWLQMVGYDCALVLFFDCPEDVLEARLLGRNQGRSDDNIETIKKRFRVFMEQSMPVVAEYKKIDKVAHIDTNRPVDEIYKEVRRLITEL